MEDRRPRRSMAIIGRRDRRGIVARRGISEVQMAELDIAANVLLFCSARRGGGTRRQTGAAVWQRPCGRCLAACLAFRSSRKALPGLIVGYRFTIVDGGLRIEDI